MMYKYIDLTRELGNETPVFPGDSPAEITKEADYGRDGYMTSVIKAGLHAGTHLDFPAHFLPGGALAGAFPPESFAGRGVLLDVRGEESIRFRGEFADRVEAGDIVLLYTGWENHYGGDGYFEDHPVIDAALAEFFALRGIKMLGLDMPGPDRVPFHAHRTLLSAGVLLLENLCGLGGLLDAKEFEVFAPPLKIKAEASPVRAFARIRL